MVKTEIHIQREKQRERNRKGGWGGGSNCNLSASPEVLQPNLALLAELTYGARCTTAEGKPTRRTSPTRCQRKTGKMPINLNQMGEWPGRAPPRNIYSHSASACTPLERASYEPLHGQGGPRAIPGGAVKRSPLYTCLAFSC